MEILKHVTAPMSSIAITNKAFVFIFLLVYRFVYLYAYICKSDSPAIYDSFLKYPKVLKKKGKIDHYWRRI